MSDNKFHLMRRSTPMSVLVLFLVGVGVGCLAMWLLRILHTDPDEPDRVPREGDPDYYYAKNIEARIAEENPRAGRHRYRAHRSSINTRAAGNWPTTASAF
ncbi:hypothetical protein ACIP5Y_07360 [Nocardia sp. NPDC088792]|uniref:hypothetical protein n=1 Tax=Nocardia sp. NPDC088792 TaxID=3364332 RepID=UPI0037F81B8B